MSRRPRSGIWAELVLLGLIFSCLAGALGLIVAAYRRPKARPARSIEPAVVARPAPRPLAIPPPVAEPTPEPSPASVPAEDPTPKVLAKFLSAEAEQLAEAEKADRKAKSLEAARASAEAEAEKWRRRQSLIQMQVSKLDANLRKLERNVDALSLERDALRTEVDARKAAAAMAASRPSQAILPHKGPNGTWRRPIVVECRNGAAVIQPAGREFGVLDLESGFGTVGNAFVGAIAAEAVRIQRGRSPDGKAVVPYVFFVVRPDGIRPYYEARGKLEALGVTFGYELADQDMAIDFPDLDDPSTWDGSAPRLAVARPPTSSTRSASPTGFDGDDFPSTARPRDAADPNRFVFGSRGTSAPRSTPTGAGLGRLAWPSRSDGGVGGGGTGREGSAGQVAAANPSMVGGPGGDRPSVSLDQLPPGFPAGFLASRSANPTETGESARRPSDAIGQGGRDRGPVPVGVSEGSPSGTADDPGVGMGREVARPLTALDPATRGPSTRLKPTGSDEEKVELALDVSTSGPTGPPSTVVADSSKAAPDPADAFVWDASRTSGGKPPRGRLASARPPGPSATFEPSGDRQGSTPEVDPFADDSVIGQGAGRPGSKASARPGTGSGDLEKPATQTSSGGGSTPPRVSIGEASDGGPSTSKPPADSPPLDARGVGINAPSMPNVKPPASLAMPDHLPPMLPEIPQGMTIPPIPPTAAQAALERLGRKKLAEGLSNTQPRGPSVDRTARAGRGRPFEVVVVCGPKGVVVQPGSYRVTADALNGRENLFKKQLVGLVKNQRVDAAGAEVEPSVRFLIEPGGAETYRAARGHFLMSGLDWPSTMQVADLDPLTILPREGW